ncbi:glycosyltransferase family 9 protein [Aestuariispira insulae]|uniref:Glycosyl transferase family 9 (Putative heptosyltransferase) n=1 Tax=Aestuariispira insulae TaxID=1461337 RepID=A0A3D9HP84_9PROT|nr:glycosyltransferase family 9 protein [Aestuariispira insulae]RED51308.1 glycosyl transferase family 9 (putative heptosyltransferase) [Aestuariispira insulae]
MPLLLRAAEDPTVGLYSFQKDLKPGGQAILNEQPHVVPLGQRKLDLDAVAATMQKMDVIITVDSALAHLAGSLNKPCWLMLPYVPDFRWGTEGAETEWYSSVRLFRQKKPGDWKPVVMEICQAFTEMAAA